MKIYLITHKESTTITQSLNRYKELGYEPIIHNGLNINEDLIDKNQVCYLNFLNVLEKDNGEEDIIISEDDVYLNEKIEILNKDKMNWLGFWRHNKTELCGSMVIYIPKQLLPHVIRQFKSKTPCHLDYFLKKYMDCIVRSETICKELQHHSVIDGKTRSHQNILL
tara:strand:- start:52 stop:549 length:498 start_codon:yes stop_codon:yes gene_type:complete